jgi:hypothetical protein
MVTRPPYGVDRPFYDRWGPPPRVGCFSSYSCVGFLWWDHLFPLNDKDVGHPIMWHACESSRGNITSIRGLALLGSVLDGSLRLVRGSGPHGVVSCPLCGPTTTNFFHSCTYIQIRTCTCRTLLFLQKKLSCYAHFLPKATFFMVLTIQNYKEITINTYPLSRLT